MPCYDMDLLWHTHQVHPLDYATDSMKILGMLLGVFTFGTNRARNALKGYGEPESEETKRRERCQLS